MRHRFLRVRIATRHWIQGNYWWLVTIITISSIVAIFQCVETANDRVTMAGSVLATAIASFYFMQQQRLAETVLLKELFTEFNSRYDLLNDKLALIANRAHVEPCSDEYQTLIDYFNLCAEEYFFYSQGYVPAIIWKSWCRGMAQYMSTEPFRMVWTAECKSESHYGLTAEIMRSSALPFAASTTTLTGRDTNS